MLGAAVSATRARGGAPRTRLEAQVRSASAARAEAAMSTLDLRLHARRTPPLALDLSGVPEAELEAARKNWRERMVSEHASARVFAGLVAPMMRAGIPEAEVHRVSRMVTQELDHARLCARVLHALGGEPVAELPRLDEPPRHDGISPLAAVLRNVISVGCCSETVAVALVSTERELAGPPALRDVLDRILADEIKHSRLGWRLVARYAPALSARDREDVDLYLPDVFAHQLRFHAPFLEMGCASATGTAIGAPHGRSNWAVFLACFTQTIVPGLESVGLDARAAWETAVAEVAPRARARAASGIAAPA